MTINARAADAAITATAQGSTLTLYTLKEDWAKVGRVTRTKIMIHELFHVLQSDVRWLPDLRDDTGSVIEGTAEFVGFAGVAERGLTTYEEVRRCQIEKYFEFGGASLPRLEQFSPSAPGSYVVAWLAVDHLLGGIAGLPKLARYWQSGPPWTQAFQTAFGSSVTAFYSDFAEYRRTLASPGGCSDFYR